MKMWNSDVRSQSPPPKGGDPRPAQAGTLAGISATGMSTITVTAASGNQTEFYVALPLEGSHDYTFACTTSAGVEYRGTKTGNLTNGKYYTASVDIAPGVGVTNTSAWGNNSTDNIGNIYF